MIKGNRIRITEAEGDTSVSTLRTVYAVTDDGWYDTHGTFWPTTDDQFRYTREDNQ